jgi:hypothetical protein
MAKTIVEGQDPSWVVEPLMMMMMIILAYTTGNSGSVKLTAFPQVSVTNGNRFCCRNYNM